MTRIVIDNVSSASISECMDMAKQIATENMDSIKISRLYLRYFSYAEYAIEVSIKRFSRSDLFFTIKDYK